MRDSTWDNELEHCHWRVWGLAEPLAVAGRPLCVSGIRETGLGNMRVPVTE